MKKSIAMICMGLAGSVFALDEYLPVAKGAIEVDVAYGLQNSTGGYDSSGDKIELDSILPELSVMSHSIPVQIKYGIIPGLDVELLWAFQLLNASATIPVIGAQDSSYTGFGQPDIGLKYALMDLGVGAYINFTIPFATGAWKIGPKDDDAPPMALALGLVYTKLFAPQFNLTAMAGYKLNFEGADSNQAGNVISIYAKPEYRFNQFGGAYLGIQYEINSESQFNGTGNADEGNLLTLKPGWNATWTPMVSTEVTIPITLMGKNLVPNGTVGAYWGIYANVYLTFGI